MSRTSTRGCDFGQKAVQVLIDGVPSWVCQAMAADEKRKERTHLVLGFGRWFGIPLLLLALVCAIRACTRPLTYAEQAKRVKTDGPPSHQ